MILSVSDAISSIKTAYTILETYNGKEFTDCIEKLTDIEKELRCYTLTIGSWLYEKEEKECVYENEEDLSNFMQTTGSWLFGEE